jgi:hypothetical protein
MVKINNDIVNENSVTLLHKGEVVGVINNSLAFTDVRLQIQKERSSDYSFIFEGKEIKIGDDGVFQKWPNDLYCLEAKMLGEMLRGIFRRGDDDKIQ